MSIFRKFLSRKSGEFSSIKHVIIGAGGYIVVKLKKANKPVVDYNFVESLSNTYTYSQICQALYICIV